MAQLQDLPIEIIIYLKQYLNNSSWIVLLDLLELHELKNKQCV
jgi:hypothetical protein